MTEKPTNCYHDYYFLADELTMLVCIKCGHKAEIPGAKAPETKEIAND